jgi:hypothetical protein
VGFPKMQKSVGKLRRVCHTPAHVVVKFTDESARADFHADFSALDGDGRLLRSSRLRVVQIVCRVIFWREEILCSWNGR